jgi:hypothetical protein
MTLDARGKSCLNTALSLRKEQSKTSPLVVHVLAPAFMDQERFGFSKDCFRAVTDARYFQNQMKPCIQFIYDFKNLLWNSCNTREPQASVTGNAGNYTRTQFGGRGHDIRIRA